MPNPAHLRRGSSTTDDQQKPGILSKNGSRSLSPVRALNIHFRTQSLISDDSSLTISLVHSHKPYECVSQGVDHDLPDSSTKDSIVDLEEITYMKKPVKKGEREICIKVRNASTKKR
jgi:hypothetical protein